MYACIHRYNTQKRPRSTANIRTPSKKSDRRIFYQTRNCSGFFIALAGSVDHGDPASRTPLTLAYARVLSVIRPRVLATLRTARTPVTATRAKTKDRVFLLTRSLMLGKLMMRMRSDFGLPIGTKHAHHQPK
jgi:hypothetical protein